MFIKNANISIQYSEKFSYSTLPYTGLSKAGKELTESTQETTAVSLHIREIIILTCVM